MSYERHHGDRREDTDDPVAALLESPALRDHRHEPTPERWQRVEAQVRVAWHRTIAARRRRQRQGLALAAVLAAAVLGLWWRSSAPPTATVPDAPLADVAIVTTIDGTVLRRAGGGGPALPLRIGDAVRPADRLETDDGRLGLTLASGASLRFDIATVATLGDPGQLQLANGALYFDDHRATADAAIRVATPLGTARDVGTRFALRLDTDTLRVAVRDGEVALERPGGSMRALAGDEVVVSADGAVERRAITPFDRSWAWTAAVAPGFDLDGATLAAFIGWLEHESGWTVRFNDPTLAAATGAWTLAGPRLEGLSFEDALAMALRINDLTYVLADGVVTIDEGDRS